VISFTVYGFRTNGLIGEQYLTGVLRLWDGVPGALGSNIIAGDLTTNILQSTAFTNIYRTGRSSASTTRPIMAATLTLPSPITLGPGTYWMDYGLTSPGTNTFAPLVTRPGEVEPAGANGMLFTSAQWYTMLDNNSNAKMEVPFQVIGIAGVELSGTLALGDSVGAFAMPRTINYTVMQGTNTVGSGTMTANSSSSPLNFSVFSTTPGPAEIIFDGSSWLRRRVNVTLTGSPLSLGTVSMQNGDVDGSGEVDAADIDAVIADFGTQYPGGPTPEADVDVSGEVDAADIDIVIANFGGQDD